MPPKQHVRITNAALYDGTMLVGANPLPLNLDVHCNEVLIQADPDNTANIWVGTIRTQSVQLQAGAVEIIPIDTPAKIYVRAPIGTVDQRVNFHAVGG